ncbi:MAG: SHOCT domain-containing protein [Phycisphaerae bacterium]|nr:SHOCT domain-containing protein [Phycisphaerae bacterium]
MTNQLHQLGGFLAQTAVPPSQSAANVRFWLVIAGLVAMISVGSMFIFWARRWARGPVPTNRPGFTLEDLRAMLDRGEITQREYDTARDTMINKARQAASRERERRGGSDWSGPESERPKRKPGR